MMNDTLYELTHLLGTTDRRDRFVEKLDNIILQKGTIDSIFTEKEAELLNRYRFEELASLRDSLFKIPVQEIRIAFRPSIIFTRQIVAKQQSQFKYPVLISIVTDESVIGGVTIEFSGKYLDYSLRKKIDVWLNEKTEAPANG